jgi:hypothetical protein
MIEEFITITESNVYEVSDYRSRKRQPIAEPGGV